MTCLYFCMKINVKVITRAHKKTVEKIDDNHYIVRTTDVPVDGKANRSVQKLLAKHFDVAKSCVQIVKGITSKNKVVDIDNR